MEFKQSPWSTEQRRQSLRSRVKDGGAGGEQPLQMYLLPPTGDVTLEEFDALAAERLQGRYGGMVCSLLLTCSARTRLVWHLFIILLSNCPSVLWVSY